MLLVVFMVSCLTTYLLIKVAPAIGLLAHPGEHRQHEQATPLLGGVAIFIGIVLGYFLISDDYKNLLPSLLLLCAVGLIDDRLKLPSYLRFIAQAIAAYLMIEMTGVQLTQLGALVSKEIVVLNAWSVPLTIFAVIGVINAVNMSDGMDGLAGSLVVLVLLALLLLGSIDNALITTSIASVLGFLVWNLRLMQDRAKIFMGDAGSTMLGLLVAYLLIKATQQPAGNFDPVTALWLLALPLLDAVAVLLVRPLRGKSPFLADRIHYHHMLTDAGLTVNQVLLVVVSIQAAFIAIGLGFNQFVIAENIQFYMFLLLFILYLMVLLRVTKEGR